MFHGLAKLGNHVFELRRLIKYNSTSVQNQLLVDYKMFYFNLQSSTSKEENKIVSLLLLFLCVEFYHDIQDCAFVL